MLDAATLKVRPDTSAIQPGKNAATIIAAAPAEIRRIVVLGDTGCRIKKRKLKAVKIRQSGRIARLRGGPRKPGWSDDAQYRISERRTNHQG